MDDLKLDEIKNNLDEMLFELKEEYIKKAPKEIYDELSEYIIGQDDAKKNYQWHYINITYGLIIKNYKMLKKVIF